MYLRLAGTISYYNVIPASHYADSGRHFASCYCQYRERNAAAMHSQLAWYAPFLCLIDVQIILLEVVIVITLPCLFFLRSCCCFVSVFVRIQTRLGEQCIVLYKKIPHYPVKIVGFGGMILDIISLIVLLSF